MHLVLLVAGALSLLAGLAVSEILALMPCQGEDLACRIDDAIGAYAVLISATLGPLIFAVLASASWVKRISILP
jgi:hypothetical protein